MAATLVSASFGVTVSFTYRNALDLTNVDDTLSALAFAAATLTNGPGLAQGNQLWHDRRTLASAATETIDCYEFAIDGGAANVDSLGLALTMVRVKAILFYNRSATAGEVFKLFGEGTTAAWSTPLNGVDTTKIVVQPGGVFLLTAPSAAGLVVADTTDHLLKVENSGSSSNDYDLIIIGAST